MFKLPIYIDADPIVYEMGFAMQDTYYEVDYQTPGGDVASIAFEDGYEKNTWIKEHHDYLCDTTKIVTPKPLPMALGATRDFLKRVIEEVTHHYNQEFYPVLYLTGKGNFRETVSTRKGYKESRIGKDKPVHYQAIRDYLVDIHGAVVVDGIEADDAVSIAAQAVPDSVVATIDKDLDQTVGRHYNYQKHVHYEIDDYEAMIFFYDQCISGDSTDDIPGAYLIGEKKAKEIIQQATEKYFNGEYLEPWTIEQRLWWAVIMAYRTTTEKTKCPYTSRDVAWVTLETARLVKMQEYEGQLWTPPGLPDKDMSELTKPNEKIYASVNVSK